MAGMLEAVLAEARAELELAREAGDLGRSESLLREIGLLEQELGAALGVGNRPRTFGSNAERARVAVRHRVRDALAQLLEVHEPMHRHLKRTLRTGLTCEYAPEPDDQIRWQL